MARKISQLNPATLPLPGSSTLFLTTINDESFNVSLNQIRTNPTFTGTVTIPTPLSSSNGQDAASTSWVRTYTSSYTSSLTFPITQGGTGSTTASGARTNLGLGSISTQNSNAITITGGSINSTSVGITTPSNSKFTNVIVAPSSNGTSQSWLNTSGGTAVYVDSFGNLVAGGIVQGGAIQSNGGVTGATLSLSSTTASTATNNGAAVIAGGLGVGGTINAGALSLGSALPIASGGTGATSASAARTALGLDPATSQYNASQLRGQTINATTPTTNQTLIYRSGEWQPRGIIQWLSIQQAITASLQSITSTSMVATALTITVTPKSTSSRFKIIANVAGIAKGGADTWLKAELRRGSTNIGTISGTAGHNVSSSTNSPGSCGIMLLDVPNTTSAITYTVFVAAGISGGVLTIQANGETSSILVEEYEI